MPAVEIHSSPKIRAALALLEASALPMSDLTEAHMEHFFYTGSETAPTGLVGLEFRGIDALLRSLVVALPCRSEGLGRALVGHAESYARAHGTRSLFLLTTTADVFFSRCGYVRVARESAPESIRHTREFADICPASSTFMVKQLQIGGTPV